MDTHTHTQTQTHQTVVDKDFSALEPRPSLCIWRGCCVRPGKADKMLNPLHFRAEVGICSVLSTISSYQTHFHTSHAGKKHSTAHQPVRTHKWTRTSAMLQTKQFWTTQEMNVFNPPLFNKLWNWLWLVNKTFRGFTFAWIWQKHN